jgi:hypothetical protein
MNYFFCSQDLDDSMAVMHTFFLCVVDAACVS